MTIDRIKLNEENLQKLLKPLRIKNTLIESTAYVLCFKAKNQLDYTKLDEAQLDVTLFKNGDVEFEFMKNNSLKIKSGHKLNSDEDKYYKYIIEK